MEERELSPDDRWTESVDRALRDTWLQREINASLGLLGELSFPTQDQSVMVSSCAIESVDTVLVRLSGGDLPDGSLRIEPHVFCDGEELVPKAGSYLAMLQGSSR